MSDHLASCKYAGVVDAPKEAYMPAVFNSMRDDLNNLAKLRALLLEYHPKFTAAILALPEIWDRSVLERFMLLPEVDSKLLTWMVFSIWVPAEELKSKLN